MTVSPFVRLYKSKLAVVRERPNLRTLPTRKSIWLTRSPYNVPGETRLIVSVAVAPADSARPSDGTISALVYVRFAASAGPGMLWYVPLTSTSTFGIVYELSNLICVRNGVTEWQYDA